MLGIKGALPKEKQARYRTYRRSFAVLSAVFFLFFLLGVVFATWRSSTLSGIDAAERFALHWKGRSGGDVFRFASYGFWILLPNLLVGAVFGITIYGPVCAGLSASVSAFFLGNYLRLLIGFSYLAGNLKQALWFGLGLLLPSVVVLVGLSFSVAASLRIFTPKREGVREEEMVFGGTLFCAPYFEKTINLRFLVSYLCCQTAFCILLFSTLLLQALMVLKL